MSRKYYENISFRNRGEIFASKENTQALKRQTAENFLLTKNVFKLHFYYLNMFFIASY